MVLCETFIEQQIIMHKSNIDKENHQEIKTVEHSPLSEKDLKEISERKKLQNKVFEKMMKDLKKK